MKPNEEKELIEKVKDIYWEDMKHSTAPNIITFTKRIVKFIMERDNTRTPQQKRLDEKELLSIASEYLDHHLAHSLVNQIMQKFGHSVVSVPVEEIEKVIADNLKEALEGLNGYNWGLTPKAISILSKYIKNLIDGRR